MTKHTHIVVVLDRSGSMYPLAGATIEGYNKFISDQREVAGTADVTLVQFDDKYEVNFEGVDLRHVKELNSETYRPRGWTALRDAVGRTIRRTRKQVAKNEQVIFVIMTDGAENASKNVSQEKMIKLVTKARKRGWKFLFLGANIDAFAVGASYGFDAKLTSSYEATVRGQKDAYVVASGAVSRLRDN